MTTSPRYCVHGEVVYVADLCVIFTLRSIGSAHYIAIVTQHLSLSPPLSCPHQVGWFYRKALNAEERTRLVQNIAGHLKNAAEFIQDRAVRPHPHCDHTHNV